MIENVAGQPEASSAGRRGEHAHRSPEINYQRTILDPMTETTDHRYLCSLDARTRNTAADNACTSLVFSAGVRIATRIERALSPDTCEQSRISRPWRNNKLATSPA